MTPPSIHLAVYSNGFILEEGAFRPYTDPLSRVFIKSLVNGQFPDELRDSYPTGVPIQMFDRHEDVFVDKSYPTWQGKGTVATKEIDDETGSLSSSTSSEDLESETRDMMSLVTPSFTWNPIASVVPQKERAPTESSTSRIATMLSTPKRK